MSATDEKIIEAIVDLLDTETNAIRAGQLSFIAETAERKSRLMQQLLMAEPRSGYSERAMPLLQMLKNSLESNLRACNENIRSIKEIIDLHLIFENDMESDGTYSKSGKLSCLA